MGEVIGVLPASGRASRIGGIPKFCIPISDSDCLISWHHRQLLEVSDRVVIATRQEWVPLVRALNLEARIVVKEPSTMNDAILEMCEDASEIVVGMPDTFISGNGTNQNMYSNLFNYESEIVCGVWPMTPNLVGKVGQLNLDANWRVTASVDKDPTSDFAWMWGTMRIKDPSSLLDPKMEHPGKQISGWINSGLEIFGSENKGSYIDVGSFAGLVTLFKTILD